MDRQHFFVYADADAVVALLCSLAGISPDGNRRGAYFSRVDFSVLSEHTAGKGFARITHKLFYTPFEDVERWPKAPGGHIECDVLSVGERRTELVIRAWCIERWEEWEEVTEVVARIIAETIIALRARWPTYHLVRGDEEGYHRDDLSYPSSPGEYLACVGLAVGEEPHTLLREMWGVVETDTDGHACLLPVPDTLGWDAPAFDWVFKGREAVIGIMAAPKGSGKGTELYLTCFAEESMGIYLKAIEGALSLGRLRDTAVSLVKMDVAEPYREQVAETLGRPLIGDYLKRMQQATAGGSAGAAEPVLVEPDGARRGARAEGGEEKGGRPLEPQRPPEPERGAGLDAWFDWYHKCQELGYKATLKYIAHKVGLSYGYVKNMHALYLAERAESQYMTKT